MRGKIAIRICLILLQVTVLFQAGSLAVQSNVYGPEVRSFLELMRHEEDELEYLIKHN